MVIVHISLFIIKSKLDQNEDKLTESIFQVEWKVKLIKNLYVLFLLQKGRMRCMQCIISACLLVFVENNFSTSRTHIWQRVSNPQTPCIGCLPPFFKFFDTSTPFLFFCVVSMASHMIAANFLIIFTMISLQSGFSKQPWWERGLKILMEGNFLLGSGNQRRSNFDHPNLFQS